MKALERRLIKLEDHACVSSAALHFLSVLRYPYGLGEEGLQAWLTEKCRCACTPHCPGKRIGVLVPEKEASPEAWAENAQRWSRERSFYQRWDD